MNYAVLTDSGSNYFNSGITMKGLYAVCLQIIDGDKSYQEDREIDIDRVNQLMREGHLLKTSLPKGEDIDHIMETIKHDGYDGVFAVPITSGLSGTINAMKLSAEMHGLEFVYVDCYSTAHIALDSAIAARRLLDSGSDIDTVRSILHNHIDMSDTYVIPDNLEHLSRGGRLSPLAAKLGGFLKIKPILHLNPSSNGVIDPLDKVRTMRRAMTRVIEIMKDNGVDGSYKITLAHVAAPALLEEAKILFKDAFPDSEIVSINLVSTVSVHCGIGAFALQYMKKYD